MPDIPTNEQASQAQPDLLTAAGQVLGTPQYMAPEQIKRPLEVDHRADIYSLGVVFYQMLTGELPDGHFVPPSKKVQIDVRLDEVVLRAMEKEPQRRYQQAVEMKTQVETIATTPVGCVKRTGESGSPDDLGAFHAPYKSNGIPASSSLESHRLFNLKSVSASIVVFIAALLLAAGSFIRHSDTQLFLQVVSCVIGVVGFRAWWIESKRQDLIGALIIVIAGVVLLATGSFIRHADTQLFVQVVGCVLGAIGLYGWIVAFQSVGCVKRTKESGLPDDHGALHAPYKTNKKQHTLGLAALIFCLVGIPTSLLYAALAGRNWSVWTFLALELSVVIVALILGIIGRKSGMGKSAMIISSFLLLIGLGFLGVVIFDESGNIHRDFGGRPVIEHRQPISEVKADIPKHPSTLEFRILANKQDKTRQGTDSLVEFFSNNPSKTELIDPSGIELARWVPVKAGEEKAVVNSPDIVQRKSKRGSREITEVLVFTLPPNVTSKHLLHVEAGVSQTGRPCIKIQLDKEGAIQFGKLTSGHLPDPLNNITYRLGIIIDGELWAAPSFRTAIFDQCEITGSFTMKEATEIAASLNAGREKLNASTLAQSGWQLWRQGKLTEAVAKFRAAIELEPKNANAWNGLGWASFNSGKLPEAEKAFQKVISLEPNHPAALNGLGQLYLMRRKYAEAEHYLLKAAPKATAAWWGLAKLYLLQGKYEEAEKWAQEIVDSGEGGDDARRMLGAAKDKHLDDKLRAIIEPPPVTHFPAGEDEPSDAPESSPAELALPQEDEGDKVEEKPASRPSVGVESNR